MNDLLERVATVLSTLGMPVSRQQPGTADAADAVMTVDAGTRGRNRYHAAVKLGRLDRQRAAAMALPEERPLLVVAPHVTDGVAEILRERGVDFVDTAGNARLAWEGVLVDVRGRRPLVFETPRNDPAASRAFTRSGAMVVFVLLSLPGAAARPVREIAAASGTAVGTTHTVLGALAAAGYLSETTGAKALNRGGELLDRWAEAYSVNLAARLTLGSFALGTAGRESALEEALIERGAQVGGELAGSRLDAHLRPASATFYIERIPPEVIARFRLRRDDHAGTVQLRHRFWRWHDLGGTLVPSPLVYADLLASGDPRQREHARRIRTVDDRLVELDRS